MNIKTIYKFPIFFLYLVSVAINNPVGKKKGCHVFYGSLFILEINFLLVFYFFKVNIGHFVAT
jgi:hypothetical protein